MKRKMDAVDTEQQRQIDGLITMLTLVSAILVVWCACLTAVICYISK